MKAIIIPKEQKDYYSRKFDAYNAIEPVETNEGEYFLPLTIIDYLGTLQNGNYPESIKVSAKITIDELWKFEIRELNEN